MRDYDDTSKLLENASHTVEPSNIMDSHCADHTQEFTSISPLGSQS